MKLTYLVFIFFSLLNVNNLTFAQSFVTGTIVDTVENRLISSGKVQISNDIGIKTGYPVNSDGTFSIPLNIYTKASDLQIFAQGFKPYSLNKLPRFKRVNGVNLLDTIFLIPQTITLKEVIVKKRRKYRDTLNIDLSKENFDRSFMIEDFLSGQKGFSKSTNGKLFFRGKEVADIVLNDGSFFGKNNLDIYKYLPSLTLSNIEVTETNIDSITNTIMLRPKIKVNLKLKQEYKKGKFGSVNLGYGTANRHLIATDLYKYKNSEQISLIVNVNNINSGDNPFVEPNVSFAANGNNISIKSAKLAYRNLFLKNTIEINASAKIKTEDREFISEMLRREETFDQFSKTTNASFLKTLDVEQLNLNLAYRIDSLNNLTASLSSGYNHNRQKDSLRYEIKSDNQSLLSQINKSRQNSVFYFSNNLKYQKRFSGNRGRLFKSNIVTEHKTYATDEFNNVFSVDKSVDKSYVINGDRAVTQETFQWLNDFTEPWDDNGYINFSINYKNEKLKTNINSTGSSTSSIPAIFNLLTNRYIQPAVKIQKTIKNFSLDGEIFSIINFREIQENSQTNDDVLHNLLINTSLDYKINSKNNLVARYSTRLNYPSIPQLTAINNSFDLISQTNGNIYLRPEIVRKADLSYTTRKKDSLTIMITGNAENYKSKLAFIINNQPNSFQTNYTDNIGSSNSYNFNFSLNKVFKKGTIINYSSGFVYTENPIVLNQQMTKNIGKTLNQSLSSSFSLFSLFNFSPILSLSITKYQYGDNKTTLYNFTYADKISVALPKKITLNLYPLTSYTYSINNNLTWALNGEVKRSFFKNYCSVWLKAYDIFNTFSYINNYIGPNYSQSSKYSNLNRYLIMGASIKLNDMK